MVVRAATGGWARNIDRLPPLPSHSVQRLGADLEQGNSTPSSTLRPTSTVVINLSSWAASQWTAAPTTNRLIRFQDRLIERPNPPRERLASSVSRRTARRSPTSLLEECFGSIPLARKRGDFSALHVEEGFVSGAGAIYVDHVSSFSAVRNGSCGIPLFSALRELGRACVSNSRMFRWCRTDHAPT